MKTRSSFPKKRMSIRSESAVIIEPFTRNFSQECANEMDGKSMPRNADPEMNRSRDGRVRTLKGAPAKAYSPIRRSFELESIVMEASNPQPEKHDREISSTEGGK
jgi:hypothetical protein